MPIFTLPRLPALTYLSFALACLARHATREASTFRRFPSEPEHHGEITACSNPKNNPAAMSLNKKLKMATIKYMDSTQPR